MAQKRMRKMNMNKKEKEEAITKLHGMFDDKLVGIISDEETTADWMLVFEKHTINISGKFKLKIDERSSK